MRTYRLTYLGEGVVQVEGAGLFQLYTTAYVGEDVALPYKDNKDWSCVEIRDEDE